MQDNNSLMLLIVTTVGVIAAIIFGRQNSKHNKIKRQHDLFDKRYEFYKRLEKWWTDTRYHEETPLPHEEILIQWASEANYLFGQDISQHILSLEGRRHDGSPYFANDDFSKPFDKYLKLK